MRLPRMGDKRPPSSVELLLAWALLISLCTQTPTPHALRKGAAAN